MDHLDPANILLSWESPEAFEKMRRELMDFYEPADAVERYSVDDMLMARWKIGRLTVFKDVLLRFQKEKFNPAESDGANSALLSALTFIKPGPDVAKFCDRQIAQQRRFFKMAQETFCLLRNPSAPRNSGKKEKKTA
jgi:hypothetical protein